MVSGIGGVSGIVLAWLNTNAADGTRTAAKTAGSTQLSATKNVT